MNRIETALQALQEKKEKAFITYITAGLPDYDKGDHQSTGSGGNGHY